MPRYPTRLAVSAGGLVIDQRQDDAWVVLIARRNHAGELQWMLPKGGIEEGEDHETAALREVREETGLDCRITGPLGTIDYWFVWRADEVRYHKYVHYFTMVAEGGSLDAHDDEADEVAWMPVERALESMAHANERELVEQLLDGAVQGGPVRDDRQ